MKSGTIYIKRRHTNGLGYVSWNTIKEKHYTSVFQRKQLLITLAARYFVNDNNIVISVMPREKD